MVNYIVHIAALGQSHYMRPKEMGGGGGTFNGFSMPNSIQETAYAEYTVTSDETELTITGNSKAHLELQVTFLLSTYESGEHKME